MLLRLNAGSDEAEVRDIRVPSDNDLASKMSFDPERIRVLEFLVSPYKLFDDNGERKASPESSGMIYGTSLSLENGDNFKIKRVGLGFDFGNMYDGEFNNTIEDYYAEFVVRDTQGDSHRLNLIHID